MNVSNTTPPIPRGSVIEYAVKAGDDPNYFVLLSDVSALPDRMPPLQVGVILLTPRQDLPKNDLYPVVVGRSGATGNGLMGTWYARADRVSCIYSARIVASGQVSGPELSAIDHAVRRMFGPDTC